MGVLGCGRLPGSAAPGELVVGHLERERAGLEPIRVKPARMIGAAMADMLTLEAFEEASEKVREVT